MQTSTRYGLITTNAGTFCILACCFFIPFSTSISGTTAILALLFWLLSGKFLQLPGLCLKHPPVLLCLALFAFLCVGVSYSPVPFNDAISFLKKYRELLYFAVVTGFVIQEPKLSRQAENCFVAGCIVLMLVSYGIFFQLIPSERYGYSIVYHITHSFFMGVLAFWCLHRTIESKQYRYLWLLTFVLVSINLFYVTPGRTGMLVYMILMGIFLVQRLSFKNFLAALVIVVGLFSVIYFTSSNFSTRVHEAVHEIENYQASKSRTSLGMRFDWWHNSIDLIKAKPILGHGTGSFQKVQGDLIKKTRTKPTDNPHNEYLLLSVQVGLGGGILFVAIMISLVWGSLKLPRQQKYLLQGVVVAMATGCLMNSLLFDSLQGHFFAFLSAVLYSSNSLSSNNLTIS